MKKTIVDKRTIIEYLVKEGVTSEELSEMMQIRCKEKKRIGNATGFISIFLIRILNFVYFFFFFLFCLEKKSGETTKEKKMNGTMDENSNSSIISIDGKDNSENIKDESSPKRNVQRTVKGKVTKYGSDDDDNDDGNQENIDENESDYIGSDSEIEKKIKKN